MKRTGFKTNKLSLLVAAVCMMTFFACDDQGALDNNVALDVINDDIELESSYEEVDDLALAGASHDFSTGGRSERDGRFECAEVTKEETDTGAIITIDFGDGCEGPNGRVRAGIIRITKTGDHWDLGSMMTAEMIGFSIDDLMFEGTRSVTNISESVDTNPTFKVTLIGGKATWPDGTSATREVNRVRTLIKSDDSELGREVWVDGTTNGVNREGESIDVQIIETLIFKRSCRAGKKFIPVSGVKQITKGEVVITIDFGDGECDNIAIKTVDGVSTEITIKKNRRKG
jgi:hypothetical protein